MNWEGPHQIGEYLGSVAQSPGKRPPEAPGVYVVSEKPWNELPMDTDKILYVGQATYLRYQIGRLMCDLLGFTGDEPSPDEAFQHKGGHSLWSSYCLPHRIEPAKLYFGWCREPLCMICAETRLLEIMIVGPQRIRICQVHRPALDLAPNCRGISAAAQNSNGRQRT